MAERKPLPGWDETPNGRYHVFATGGIELWVTDEGYEVDLREESDGHADGRLPAQLAAEDAARALVAEMADALGGRVVWGTEGGGE